MPEVDLNILLRLIDNASEEVKRINKEAIGEVNKLAGVQKEQSKEVEKQDTSSSKKMQDNAKRQRNALEKTSLAYTRLRRQMLVFTLAIGFAALAINTFGQTSDEAKKFLDDLGLAAKNTLSKLGEYITVAAEFYKITGAVKNFNEQFGNEKLNNITEAANALKNFGEEQKNNSNLFIAGKSTATDYFENLLTYQDSAILRNQQFA